MRKIRRLPETAGFLLVCGGFLGVAGCVNPSEKIANALTRYGLNQTQAQCMGDRLEANLSTGQLQQLSRAARAVNKDDSTPGRPTPSDLIRVSSQLDDIKVPIEVAKAAAGCGILTEPAAAL